MPGPKITKTVIDQSIIGIKHDFSRNFLVSSESGVLARFSQNSLTAKTGIGEEEK